MRKKYEKPLLIIESFQLDATIAASCSSNNYVPLGYTEKECGIDEIYEGYYQFFSSYNCEMDLVGSSGDGNDTICYHGPIATGVTFINS